MTVGLAWTLRTFWAPGLLATRIAWPSQLNQTGTRWGPPSGRTVDSQITGSSRRRRSIRAAGETTATRSMAASSQPRTGVGSRPASGRSMDVRRWAGRRADDRPRAAERSVCQWTLGPTSVMLPVARGEARRIELPRPGPQPLQEAPARSGRGGSA